MILMATIFYRLNGNVGAGRPAHVKVYKTTDGL